MKDTLKIGLLGLGTVGTGVLTLFERTSRENFTSDRNECSH